MQSAFLIAGLVLLGGSGLMLRAGIPRDGLVRAFAADGIGGEAYAFCILLMFAAGVGLVIRGFTG